MGDPARREDDNLDDDEFFSPAAFKPRVVENDEFNAPEAFKKRGDPDDSGDQLEAKKTAPAPVEDKRGILERFVDSAKEGISDAGDAIKPYGDALHEFVDPHHHMDMGADFGAQQIASDRAGAAAAHERSPVSSGVASAVATLPLAAYGSPMAGGAAIGAADSAASGGDDRDQILHAFLGGAIGKGGELVGRGLHAAQEYAAPLADSLERGASRARVAATGIYGGAMKKLRGELGDEGITKLGNDIEAKGLHDAPGIAGMFPGNAERYLDNATNLADDALARHRAVAFDATRQGVAVPTARIADELDSQASRASTMFDPAGKSEAGFQSELADRIRGNSAATAQYDPATGAPVAGDFQQPFEQALENRQYLDKNIKWAQRNPHIQTPHEEESRRYAANQLRNELGNSLEEQAPELSPRWRNAQDDLNTALTVQTPAAARVYQEAGNQAVSLPTWIAGAGGIASGNPITGAAMGGMASQVKARGHSAVAGALRGMQHIAESAADDPQIAMLSKFLQSSGAGVAAGGIASENRPTPQQAMNDSRGHELPGVINQLLQDPQRAQVLGKYRAQFEQAGRTSGGIAGLVNKLNSTGTDREWQAVLQQLQQMTQRGDQ